MTHKNRTKRYQDCLRAGSISGLLLVTLAYATPVLAGDGPALSPAAQAAAQKLAAEPPVAPPGNQLRDDHSGRKESGVASIYAHAFDGRTMADGQRYEPQGTAAASKTLPLGTVAKVTNLQTGQSTEVTIKDRGPFVDGRVVDLSPHTATAIGLSREQGVTPVIVAPVSVPQTDGSVKAGAGAAAATVADQQ